jgi:N-acetylneuraminic acid mutarotase
MRRTLVVSSLVLVALVLIPIAEGASPADALGRALTLDQRVEAQAAVERVLWSHRTWPENNPGRKPPLAAVMPASEIRAKVADAARMSNGAEQFSGRAITGAQLQAEIDRQAAHTRAPDVLRELWAALGDDPHVIAEVLARPVVASRMLRAWYASLRRAEPFDAWWRSVAPHISGYVSEPHVSYRLPAIDLRNAASRAAGAWSPTHALPEANLGITGVWTGSEMIVWGGTEAGASKFNSGDRYDPATDTWQTTSGVGAPMPRRQHSAVWTGTEMIVWGGCGLLDEDFCQINTGGRYDPMTDTWRATRTAGAPSPRLRHTAVWTGSQMVVWGGCRISNDACNPDALGNSGGTYDPASDTWTATSMSGAPSPRVGHTAVWTGSAMIVWGGSPLTNTGGRYNPATDTWKATSLKKAPTARFSHTSVWTGSRMIVWGGSDGQQDFGDGAAYQPGSDRWRAIPNGGAPSPRERHTAVWTGTEMIVWGGCAGASCASFPVAGGRYDPAQAAWRPTNVAGAPIGRADHVAVWTGTEMIVWGGAGAGNTRTGGRYDPATDSWSATNANEATSAREFHTAVWTGSEMIVWGGDDRFSGTVMTGGRYTPATDSWEPTTTSGAPEPRHLHTAIWTGTEMIVWGGQYGSTVFDTGGRYDPATDSWKATRTQGAPSARSEHTAVWTGDRMVVWGGTGNQAFERTGGVYDPSSNMWTATATVGAPSGRNFHSAVWTGSRMIVWGGQDQAGFTNTGGAYDPGANAWSPISARGAPEGRYSHAAVWTGSRMLVWGGASFGAGWTLFRTGGQYDPATDSWTTTKLKKAPIGRLFFAFVWTGSRLVVWGGCTDDSTCGDSTFTGGEYDPVENRWAATTLRGAPSARGKLTGVWSGTRMIVWGGFTDDSSTYTNTGGLYAPATG